MFKRELFEKHRHKSNIEKVALVVAIGGAAVALVERISNRIPNQALGLLNGQPRTASLDNLESGLPSIQPETTAFEE